MKKIKKTIKYLRRTAKTLKKTSVSRPKMYEKIVNLSSEMYGYMLSASYSRLERRWDKWDKNNRKGAEPKLDDSKAKKYLELSIKTVNKIIKDHPNYQNIIYIKFQKAEALMNLNKEGEAVSTYKEIIKKISKE